MSAPPSPYYINFISKFTPMSLSPKRVYFLKKNKPVFPIFTFSLFSLFFVFFDFFFVFFDFFFVFSTVL